MTRFSIWIEIKIVKFKLSKKTWRRLLKKLKTTLKNKLMDSKIKLEDCKRKLNTGRKNMIALKNSIRNLTKDSKRKNYVSWPKMNLTSVISSKNITEINCSCLRPVSKKLKLLRKAQIFKEIHIFLRFRTWENILKYWAMSIKRRVKIKVLLKIAMRKV